MSTNYSGHAGKWSMWCADCGAKNHKNADECSACGYGGDELFGVKYRSNVGDPRFTSDGESGKYERGD